MNFYYLCISIFNIAFLQIEISISTFGLPSKFYINQFLSYYDIRTMVTTILFILSSDFGGTYYSFFVLRRLYIHLYVDNVNFSYFTQKRKFSFEIHISCDHILCICHTVHESVYIIYHKIGLSLFCGWKWVIENCDFVIGYYINLFSVLIYNFPLTICNYAIQIQDSFSKQILQHFCYGSKCYFWKWCIKSYAMPLLQFQHLG